MVAEVEPPNPPNLPTYAEEPSFFGGPDDEQLQAHTVEEYLSNLSLGQLIARGEGTVVCEYRRKPVTEKTLRRMVLGAWEGFVECFDDEYGGDDSSGIEDGEDEFLAVAVPLFRRLVSTYAKPWQCEEVSRKTWTVEELKAYLANGGEAS